MEYLNWPLDTYRAFFPAHQPFAFSVILVTNAGSSSPKVLLTKNVDDKFACPITFPNCSRNTLIVSIIASVWREANVQIPDSHIVAAFQPMPGDDTRPGREAFYVYLAVIPDDQKRNVESFRSRCQWATRSSFEGSYWTQFMQPWARLSVRETFAYISRYQDFVRGIPGATIRGLPEGEIEEE
ncbi:hypothetical protein CPLU01_11242 [Colletotrichum plurivorum]|uniref:Uncharacterized protein n=1 Tax=Colletotrichum plurivorum TaxID=2175906 RepID=A0A8H6K2T7_9PEZI|nr:hypothetical protein CPLU01_11242 [Colletotrichum plurivorum]